MSRRILHTFIILLIAAVTYSCSNDIDNGNVTAGAGFIRPSVSVKGDDTPDPSSFALTLTDAAGNEHTWDCVADFSPKQGFRPGRYVMTAFYGSEDGEGFGTPYYEGQSTFSVTDNETTDVAIECERVNVAVRLSVDDSFGALVSDYRAIFHSEGGGYFDYTPDAQAPLYLRAGTVEMYLHFTLLDGRSASVLMDRINVASGSDVMFALSADDAAIRLDVSGHEMRVLELTPELFAARPPVIHAGGFVPGTPLYIVEGIAPAVPVTFDVSSTRRLAEVILTVQTPSLNVQGVAREINLLGSDDEALGRLREYGAVFSSSADGKSFSLNLSDMLTRLRAGNATSVPVISMMAIDDLGQVSLPVSLTVDMQPMSIEVLPAEKAAAGASDATIRVKVASGDFADKIKIYTSLDDGVTWQAQSVLSVAPDAVPGIYDVSFTLPASVYPYVKVRIDYLDRQAALFDLEFISPDYTIDVDAFASHMTVRVHASTPELSHAITSSAYVYVNGSPANVYRRDADKSLIYVTGLTPSTVYDVSSTIFRHPQPDDFTNSVRITTEDVVQLPNGAFEETEEVINWEDLPMGGRYSQNAMPLFNRQNRTDVAASQPKSPWASVNEKTFYMAAANPNTWYMQPSTMESSNIISGAVSIKLVSVGFDPAGEAIPDYRQVSAPFIDYNPNVPNVRYRAAGKIFLGSYAYNGGSEQYDEGYPFASRPTAVNGIYRYTPGGGMPEDCGRVDVSLWGWADGKYQELAHSTGRLYPSATNASFSVPISYPMFGAKASAIRLMISSSYDIGTIEYETRHIVINPDVLTSSMTGSVLEVDELTLSY